VPVERREAKEAEAAGDVGEGKLIQRCFSSYGGKLLLLQRSLPIQDGAVDLLLLVGELIRLDPLAEVRKLVHAHSSGEGRVAVARVL